MILKHRHYCVVFKPAINCESTLYTFSKHKYVQPKLSTTPICIQASLTGLTGLLVKEHREDVKLGRMWWESGRIWERQNLNTLSLQYNHQSIKKALSVHEHFLLFEPNQILMITSDVHHSNHQLEQLHSLSRVCTAL